MAETHNHAPHDYYVPTGPSDSPDVSGYLSQDSQGSINTFMSETFDAQSYPRTKTGKRGICEVEGCYGQAVMRTDDGCNCASLQGFWRCANHHFGHNGVYVVTGQTLRNMGWDGTSPLPNIHKTISLFRFLALSSFFLGGLLFSGFALGGLAFLSRFLGDF